MSHNDLTLLADYDLKSKSISLARFLEAAEGTEKIYYRIKDYFKGTCFKMFQAFLRVLRGLE